MKWNSLTLLALAALLLFLSTNAQQSTEVAQPAPAQDQPAEPQQTAAPEATTGNTLTIINSCL